MLRKIFFSFLLSINSVALFAGSDTTKTNLLLDKISINLKGGTNYLVKGSKTASEPTWLFMNSYNLISFSGDNNPVRKYQVFDNPLLHGAAYIDLSSQIKAYGFNLNVDIIAEHRGMSYGTFSTKAMIVYPKYNFGLDTGFYIGNEKINLGLSCGNLDNERLYEGLTYYNMSYQASNIYFKWRNLMFRVHNIGDLMNYIGLGINDGRDYILSLSNLDLGSQLKCDLQAGLFSYENEGLKSGSDNDRGDGWNVAANIRNDNWKIYAQLGYRNSDYTKDFNWASAFLAGLDYKYDSEKLKLSFKGEYRYYGYYFNKGLYSEAPKFYDKSESIAYNATIGSSLYPLSQYDNPFSQWAVYTNYQDKNVMGLVFQTSLKFFFYKSFIFNSAIDLNYIRASQLKGFWYKFYDVGIGWEPSEGTNMIASFTNKGMNLTKSFPSFDLLDEAHFRFTMNWNFNLYSKAK